MRLWRISTPEEKKYDGSGVLTVLNRHEFKNDMVDYYFIVKERSFVGTN